MDLLALLTTGELAAADRAAIEAGTPGFVLMQRAGQAVAAEIMARWPVSPTVVLCGPGNNGGDGFIIAEALASAGWPVSVALLGERGSLSGDAARAAQAWRGETTGASPESVAGATVVVDALFGAGLSRPLSPQAQEILQAAEAAGSPIVAVDLPSGLAGDAGRPLGYAPACQLTITLHRKKPAHVLEPGRSLCGEVVVADIGLGAPQHACLWENEPPLWLAGFPWPEPDSHKYARGALGVVSGAALQTGAARMAARAALRLTGAVRVYAPREAGGVLAAHLEAAMLKVFDHAAELDALGSEVDAVVIGPGAGLGEATAESLRALANAGPALVVDADALTVFKGRTAELFALLHDRDVLTPHAGEFERVFPGRLAGSPERITAAREASRQSGAVVVLKGSDTVIAAPDGRAAVNTCGTAWLATAGSGDVLSGVIGGLLACRMPAFEAACAGVWLHAQAGAAFGPGLTAEDLPGQLPGVLRRLQAMKPPRAWRARPR